MKENKHGFEPKQEFTMGGIAFTVIQTGEDWVKCITSDCVEERAFDEGNKNDFAASSLRAYLNGDFFDPAWGKLLGGIVFAIAVLLIVFIGAELFTGNNLVMAFGAFDKKVSWAQVGKVWLVSYIGNFVGCLILSVIFVLAGASGTADYYAGFIGNKLSIPVGEIFFRAILCNFFVCLAVACGMKCKNEVAKFFMIILCISGFVVAGFEHCIANMATFVTAALLVPGGISLTAALKSMVIVTIGNMIGGGLLLAWPLRMMSADK